MTKGKAKPFGESPIHAWFGLTYAQYITVPRSVLQSMPVDWQRKFVALLEQMDELYDWIPNQGRYWVRLKSDDGKFVHDTLMDYDRGRRFVEPVK